MNAFLNGKCFLFVPFFVFLKAASWPTFPSMPYEAAFKNAKKMPKIKFFTAEEYIHAL